MSPKKKAKNPVKMNSEKSNMALLIISLYCYKSPFAVYFCHGFVRIQTLLLLIVSGEDELENKYRRSVQDVAILQNHIGELHRLFPLCTEASTWLGDSYARAKMAYVNCKVNWKVKKKPTDINI